MFEHPKLKEFNTKYKALLDHWKKGNCTMQEVLEAIEIIEMIKRR